MDAISQRLKPSPNFVDTSFDGLVVTLWAGGERVSHISAVGHLRGREGRGYWLVNWALEKRGSRWCAVDSEDNCVRLSPREHAESVRNPRGSRVLLKRLVAFCGMVLSRRVNQRKLFLREGENREQALKNAIAGLHYARQGYAEAEVGLERARKSIQSARLALAEFKSRRKP